MAKTTTLEQDSKVWKEQYEKFRSDGVKTDAAAKQWANGLSTNGASNWAKGVAKKLGVAQSAVAASSGGQAFSQFASNPSQADYIKGVRDSTKDLEIARGKWVGNWGRRLGQ